ncbi:MAG: heme-binding protein [Lachnospiraceae bacterium]|nr:heme-binding protein [Lachnospiraceae bacterium]
MKECNDIREIEKRCLEEEALYQFTEFSQSEALKLGSFIYEKSKKFPKPVAIEIRINHLTVFSFYPDGTNKNNSFWLKAKANTVDMTQHSSLLFWTDVQLSGSSQEDKRMPYKEYACCGGGFPLIVKNIGVVGSICVSGLPHMEDHKVIIDSLKEYLNYD